MTPSLVLALLMLAGAAPVVEAPPPLAATEALPPPTDAAVPLGGATTPAPPSTAPRAEPLRVLVMDLTGQGLSADEMRTIDGLIAVELGAVPGVQVSTGSDVKKLVQLEADKQQLGCDDESCLAEVAGALGAKLVVFGEAGRLGKLVVVNLSLYDAEKAVAVGRASAQALSVERMPDTLGPAVLDLVRPALVERGMTVPDRTTAAIHRSGDLGAEPVGPSIIDWVLLGGGAVVTVAGGAFLLAGALPFAVLPAETAVLEDAAATAAERHEAVENARAVRLAGNYALLVGTIGVLVGGVAAAVGGAGVVAGLGAEAE